jgi:hypothetical protein
LLIVSALFILSAKSTFETALLTASSPLCGEEAATMAETMNWAIVSVIRLSMERTKARIGARSDVYTIAGGRIDDQCQTVRSRIGALYYNQRQLLSFRIMEDS